MATNPCKWIHATLEGCGLQAYPRDAGDEPAFPYAVYSQESRTPVVTLGPQPANLPFTTTVSVSIWASTYAEAWRVAQKARQAMHGWQGTFEDVEIIHCLLQAEADGSIYYDTGDDKPAYSVDQTYLVSWPD